MNHYLYTRDKAFPFDLDGQIKGHAYNNGNDFSRACISYTEVNGEHAIARCPQHDIFFYILSGEGEFVVGDQRFKVKATDAVLVPKNTDFGYFGQMQAIEFMAPSFSDDCVIRTEKSPRE